MNVPLLTRKILFPFSIGQVTSNIGQKPRASGLHPDSFAGLTRDQTPSEQKSQKISSLQSLYCRGAVQTALLVVYLTLSCRLRAQHLRRCHNRKNTRTSNVAILLESNIYTICESCYTHVNGNRVKSGSNPI